MNLVYIHGNHATADSFNFIRSKLPGHKDILLEYDSNHGFYANHAAMLEQILTPSKLIEPQWQLATVELTGGGSKAGFIASHLRYEPKIPSGIMTALSHIRI